jgi:hypothetical protein
MPFLFREINMKQLFVVAGSYYSTEVLTPEIAWALLTARDPARNVSNAFEEYSDACLAAKYFSAQQGKKCPIIRIEVNHPEEVYLQEHSLNLEKLPYLSRRYGVYMNERRKLWSSETALLLKDGSFQFSPDYTPQIKFDYQPNTLDFNKIGEEIRIISETQYEAEMRSQHEPSDKRIEKKALEQVKASEIVVSPVAQPPLAALPLAPVQNLSVLENVSEEDFLSITLAHERENHLEAVKLLRTMIDTLGADKHNLTVKNLELETKLDVRRQRFLSKLRTDVWSLVLLGLPRVLIGTAIVATSLSFLSGMAFSALFIQTSISLAVLVAVKKLVEFVGKSKFFYKAQGAEIELLNQMETFSDLTFALNYDNKINPVAQDIHTLFSENQRVEEKLNTLLWLNPLLASTALSGSDEKLVEEMKVKLKKK